MMSSTSTPTNNTHHLPDFKWKSSSYEELSDEMIKLAQRFYGIPKFAWLWTTGATLLPSGKFALNDKNHALLFRQHGWLNMTSLPFIDLANPNFGNTAQEEEAVWTEDEKNIFIVAPYMNITTDGEAYMYIIANIMDEQRALEIAKVGKGGGRLAAKELKRCETEHITPAMASNVMSLIEQHVTQGLAGPTTDALSTWKSSFERDFNVRLGVKIDIKDAHGNPTGMIDAINSAISDCEAAATHEHLRDNNSTGHSLASKSADAPPSSSRDQLDRMAEDIRTLHHLVAKSQTKPHFKGDPRKTTKPDSTSCGLEGI
mmetsp:Transcript_56726/g.93826  ORF Transcript_56726/g.93826 Transcript_56726/m.93826 type:complete len:315 (+) Transcript_56726:43-987(+)